MKPCESKSSLSVLLLHLSALRRQRQISDVEANLVYIANSCLPKRESNQMRKERKKELM